MSGVEVALPIFPEVLGLTKALVDIGISASDLKQDAQACARLVEQTKHDLQYAKKLRICLFALASEHDDTLAWINGTIDRTEAALKEYAKNVPKEHVEKATLRALVQKLQDQKKWEEWGKTLGASHSSLVAAINIMHQIHPRNAAEVAKEKKDPTRACSMPPRSFKPKAKELP
ncbi:uncharacterized protein FSUBG_4953 [Fusarium subglutinans]|uniref:Uncharacterized protein n=1 Tax=Gibberella subglutinans TaxID=42677 RepID=A0A8H5Q4J2_GIBSU|nr:uncharacterized protein FSUBG_4953 [Fusarium subglutinans]KAF5608129.1 hypothetical protein FSUBG_4953 [Fusarium subglutinans]